MTSKSDPGSHSGLKFCTHAAFMGHYRHTNFHQNRRGSGTAVFDLTRNEPIQNTERKMSMLVPQPTERHATTVRTDTKCRHHTVSASEAIWTKQQPQFEHDVPNLPRSDAISAYRPSCQSPQLQPGPTVHSKCNWSHWRTTDTFGRLAVDTLPFPSWNQQPVSRFPYWYMNQ